MEKTLAMAATVCRALDEKKGENIRVIDISQISVMADYFVIAGGNNLPQVQALTENVKEKMLLADYPIKRTEGNKSSSWVLLDYGDVVVHIFDEKDRLFYDLERLWSDGIAVDVNTLLQAAKNQTDV